MRLADLLNRLSDMPFKPFRIHVSDGTALDVVQPGMMIPGESSAVLPTLFGTDEEGRRFAKRWRTVALDHITQFSDIEPAGEGRKGRRK